MILDEISLSKAPMPIEDILANLNSRIALKDRGLVVELLRLLELDHYLISDEEKRYGFRFTLVQRWWKLAQGLES